MAEIAEEVVKRIDSKLECPICLDTFKEPKLLPCFHVVCKSPCLEGLVEKNSLTCPICRYHVDLPPNGLAGLQQDFHISHLFEIRDYIEKALEAKCENCTKFPPTNYCQQCRKSMCGECTETHGKWGGFSGHKVFTMEAVKADPNKVTAVDAAPKCERHKLEARIYCETCSDLICNDCVIGIHKDHDYMVIMDIIPKVKDELVQSTQPLKEKKNEMECALKAFETRENAINNQSAAIEESIQQKFNELIKSLTNRKSQLLTRLKCLSEEKRRALESQRESVMHMYARVCGCLNFVEIGLQDKHELNIIRMKTPVFEQVDQILSEFNSKIIQPQVKNDMEMIADNHQLLQNCEEFGDIVTEETVDVRRCFTTGDGVKFSIARRQTSLEVHVRTREGVVCVKEIELSAKLINSESKTITECEALNMQNGQYQITYVSQKRGKYELHLKINGVHMKGSPFPIAIAPSLESLCKPIKVLKPLETPHRASVNSKGQIFVSEYLKGRLVVMSSKGENLFFVGKRGLGDGQFRQPCGIAIDEDDFIYVADNDNNRIQKFTPDGKFLKASGNKGSNSLQFIFPIGICYNKRDHNLYVCDQNNHRIQVITKDLTFVRSFGKNCLCTGQLQNPRYAAFDHDYSNIYVVDKDNGRVQVFSSEGLFLRTICKKSGEDTLDLPYGIAIDSSNIVYVSELSPNCVSMFTTEGDFIASFGEEGTNEGQFNRIRGLSIGEDNSLFVSEAGNARVQIFCGQ